MTRVTMNRGPMTNFGYIPFVVLGLGAIVAALFLAFDTQNKIENWVEVEGTIVAAEVVKSAARYGTGYRIDVTYEYEFDGKRYEHMISPGGTRSGTGAKAAKTKEAASYVIGSTQKLFVNPSNPEQANDALGYNLGTFVGVLAAFGGGLVFLTIGILLKKSRLFSLKAFGPVSMVKEQSIVDLLYAPNRKHTKTENKFLAEVTRFGAHAMDRIGTKEDIGRLSIWIVGQIPLEDGSTKRTWKRVKLVLDKANWRGPDIGHVSDFAALDQSQYLELCSFQYVNESEFPEWPEGPNFSV